MVFGATLNFKFFRMVYGGLFGLDHFNAPFNDSESFYKPFTFISIFSIVTTTLPLLVASIVGLAFIEFGYQIYITGIEMLIIEVLLLGLIIYEFRSLKEKLM